MWRACHSPLLFLFPSFSLSSLAGVSRAHPPAAFSRAAISGLRGDTLDVQPRAVTAEGDPRKKRGGNLSGRPWLLLRRNPILSFVGPFPPPHSAFPCARRKARPRRERWKRCGLGEHSASQCEADTLRERERGGVAWADVVSAVRCWCIAPFLLSLSIVQFPADAPHTRLTAARAHFVHRPFSLACEGSAPSAALAILTVLPLCRQSRPAPTTPGLALLLPPLSLSRAVLSGFLAADRHTLSRIVLFSIDSGH